MIPRNIINSVCGSLYCKEPVKLGNVLVYHALEIIVEYKTTKLQYKDNIKPDKLQLDSTPYILQLIFFIFFQTVHYSGVLIQMYHFNY